MSKMTRNLLLVFSFHAACDDTMTLRLFKDTSYEVLWDDCNLGHQKSAPSRYRSVRIVLKMLCLVSWPVLDAEHMRSRLTLCPLRWTFALMYDGDSRLEKPLLRCHTTQLRGPPAFIDQGSSWANIRCKKVFETEAETKCIHRAELTCIVNSKASVLITSNLQRKHWVPILATRSRVGIITQFYERWHSFPAAL